MKQALAGAILLSLTTSCIDLDGMQDQYVEEEMQKINNKVVKDSIDQYNLAKKGGDRIEICVHAGMVAAACLQAKDEKKYLKWKEVEKADCKAAGVPK